jgi:hypothetical protein
MNTKKLSYNERLYPEWNNELHRQITRKISRKILHTLYGDDKHKIAPRFYVGQELKTFRYYCDRLQFETTGLPWLDKLVIYVSNGSGFYEDETSISYHEPDDVEFESMVASFTKFYMWKNNKLVAIDNDFVVSQNEAFRPQLPQLPIFLLNDTKDKIKTATIFFIIPEDKKDEENLISYVLQHEIQHLKDMLDWKMSMNQMMKDVIINSARGGYEIKDDNIYLKFENINTP